MCTCISQISEIWFLSSKYLQLAGELLQENSLEAKTFPSLKFYAAELFVYYVAFTVLVEECRGGQLCCRLVVYVLEMFLNATSPHIAGLIT